ncbi:MAG: hypothetical protein FJY98_01085 [Candidatus Liptonbacteria bacterium]|nr:hypothetical protein [Candidatus Liptonbacteria bacterium]
MLTATATAPRGVNSVRESLDNPTLEHVRSFPFRMTHGFSLDRCPRSGFLRWHPDLHDANFPGSATHWGKTYGAEVYRLKDELTLEMLLRMAMEGGRLSLGAWTSARLCSQCREHLPKDNWAVCVGEEHERGTPGFIWVQEGTGGWGLALFKWRASWARGAYAIFFHEL